MSADGWRGIFTLKSPKELQQKLFHDFERISRDPEDAFGAYDFFVTAHHLPECRFVEEREP